MKTWHSIALGAAVAVGVAALTPFRVKREENGDFELRAALYRLTKKANAETGKDDYTLSFFCPCRKAAEVDDEKEEEIVAPEEPMVIVDETV